MIINYKNSKTFNEKELQALFLSVGWSSGNFPDKLVIAMQTLNHTQKNIFKNNYASAMPTAVERKLEKK